MRTALRESSGEGLMAEVFENNWGAAARGPQVGGGRVTVGSGR